MTQTAFSDPDTVRGEFKLCVWAARLPEGVEVRGAADRVRNETRQVGLCPSGLSDGAKASPCLHPPYTTSIPSAALRDAPACQPRRSLHRRSLTPGSGITLGGFKFMTIQANPDEVIGRKGERGVFIIPTTQAILVGEVSSLVWSQLTAVRGHARRRRQRRRDQARRLPQERRLLSLIAPWLYSSSYPG